MSMTDENFENKKRGRPKGSGLGKKSGFQHYNPKRWHPEFDLIIIESISGKTNEEIGKLFGYTKEHISNILSTPEAAKVKERIRESINKEFDGTLKDRMASIGEKVIKHVESFIQDNKGLAESDPFSFIDRAVKIGQVVGSLSSDKSGSTNIINGNALILNGSQADSLREAMEKSMSLDSIEVGSDIKLLTNGSADNISRADRSVKKIG